MSEPSLQDIADRLDDLARTVERQGVTLGGIADAAGDRTGPDLPLLVDLHALWIDVLACANTARSRRERVAFEAVAGRLERLLVGRGGGLLEPDPGQRFSAATMEVVDVVATDDPQHSRTVAAVLEPGLQVGGRSVRPARVAVYRAAETPPEPARAGPG